jgi:hypothetical protein
MHIVKKSCRLALWLPGMLILVAMGGLSLRPALGARAEHAPCCGPITPAGDRSR